MLQRNFTTDGPDKVWVSDITYIATARGWLYLTVFIDLFSRMVVGWALSSSLSAQMVLTALGRSMRNRLLMGSAIEPLHDHRNGATL